MLLCLELPCGESAPRCLPVQQTVAVDDIQDCGARRCILGGSAGTEIARV